MPEASLSRAIAVAERLRLAMCSTPFRWPFGPETVARSTGVPFAAMAPAVRSIQSGGKRRSVGEDTISVGALIRAGSVFASWFALTR